MDQILTAIARTENIAILVLAMAVIGMGWFILSIRKEHREDRAVDSDRHLTALDRNSDALLKVGEALTEIRIALASQRGQQ